MKYFFTDDELSIIFTSLRLLHQISPEKDMGKILEAGSKIIDLGARYAWYPVEDIYEEFTETPVSPPLALKDDLGRLYAGYYDSTDKVFYGYNCGVVSAEYWTQLP